MSGGCPNICCNNKLGHNGMVNVLMTLMKSDVVKQLKTD